MAKASRWLGLFRDFSRDVRISSKEVTSSDERGVPLVLWESQRRFIDEVGRGLDEGIRIFNCLKGRQSGITTICLLIDLFWLAMHPNMKGALVGEKQGTIDENRGILQHYVRSFPQGYFGESFEVIDDNRSYMSFSNGSRINFMVAGTRKKHMAWGEGRGYAFAHLCMAPGTPVIVGDGRIVPIEEVMLGDWVLTHRGAPAQVIDVLGQPNTRGPMLRLTPWLGMALTVSREHKFPTQRGMVRAEELTLRDELIMPIRPIRMLKREIQLPETQAVLSLGGNSIIAREEGWVRVESAGSGAWVPLDEEFGFVIGFYLAEGYISINRDRIPSGIVFARNAEKLAHADRAIAALASYTTGHKKIDTRVDSKTTTDTIYGTSLARWITDTFGRVRGKMVPDEVFGWGEEFCRGLLVGILAGDGSKKVVYAQDYPVNSVVWSTVHSSLAMQVRDIAASLGYGWGACRYEPPGEKHGRMCQAQWRIIWNGQAAAKLRALLGLQVVASSDGGQREKYRIHNGFVYLRLRKIESDIEVPFMWDLSVDHVDHTFRTPWGSTSNTEVGSFGDPAGLKSFEEGFAQQNPNRLFIYESTAKGYNLWREKWLSGVDDVHRQRSFFIGWWASDVNVIAKSDPLFAQYRYQPTGRELEKIQLVAQLYGHKITPEQLAWIRYKEHQAGSEQDVLEQNQPWTAADAFVTTGYSFFSARNVTASIRQLEEDQPPFYGYCYDFGNDFFGMRMRAVVDQDELELIELKVWEEPVKGASYVIGVDPAYGRNEHKDRSAISVWRCFADRLVQVAEYATHEVEVRFVAWVVAHLAGAYDDCVVNIEIQGPGTNIFQEWDSIRGMLNAEMYAGRVKTTNWEEALGQARWYLYARPDSNGRPSAKGFQSTFDSKMRMMHQMRGAYVTDELVIRSRALLAEMSNVVVDDTGSIGAPESRSGEGKDDRVFGAALAHRAWMDWRRPDLIAQGLTYQRVVDEETGAISKVVSRVNDQVYRFLKTQEELAAEPPSQVPAWREERGL